MVRHIANQVRRNHALEHATVSLMLNEGVRGPLGGYSTPWGFFVVGSLSTEQLSRIVNSALAGLNAGHSETAVSPHCGTNMAVAGLISGVLTRLALGKRIKGQWRRIPLVLGALAVGVLLSRPIGNMLQRRYTTLSEMNGLEVVAIDKLWPGDEPRLHRITTRIP